MYWVDLGTVDPDATASFYTDLFGWSVAAPDSSGYRLCSLGARFVAGLGVSESAESPQWAANFREEDLSGRVEIFSRWGGETIVAPARAGPLGDFALVADPAGAAVGLWQPRQPSGMELRDEEGSFAGLVLLAENPRSAAEFYVGAMGWSCAGGGEGLILTDGSLARVETVAHLGDDRSQWIVTFACRDVENARSRAIARGAREVAVLADGLPLIRDPCGALLGLRPSR
ncbi:hypothetical protein GCM10022198_23820 [Klugiella xanthotipulae]